jgi:hypothetical protein
MLSVNQINAQIKLGEMWKAAHLHSYPTKFRRQDKSQTYSSTRACSGGKLKEEGTNKLSLKTFKCDASRLWNSAPKEIKDCLTLNSAKNAIKKFVQTLTV